MKIVDCGVFFGSHSRERLDTDIKSVLSVLDEGGLNQALVVSLTGICHYYEDGNEETLRVCKDYSGRLIPVATLNPKQVVDPCKAAEKIADGGFKVVGFFPACQGWSMNHYSFKKNALEVADKGLIPLLTLGWPDSSADGWKELTNIPDIANLLDRFDTPIIVRWMEGAGYTLTDEYLALARDFPNLHFDVGNVVALGAIEILINEVGAERFVYGSNTPFQFLKCSLFMLQAALITEGEREKVFSGNILRIMR